MVAWSGIGMNYGHQVSPGSYDTTQVESDLTFLSSFGINRVRIAYPTYTDSSDIAHCQDMVTRALSHGFYVVWGVGVPTTENASDWALFKAYVTGTIAPWAQANGLSELSLANEVELHVDGTTLTAATARADIRSMATTVKSGGYTGKVSYATSINSQYRTPWISEGIGALGLISWNAYDVLANFQTRVTSVVSAFGNQTYISEFGCIASGFADYNDESLWYTDVVNRVAFLQSAGVPTGYFFCYRDGSFGISPNTFALVLNNGSVRSARNAIKNVVIPSFSALGCHV